MKACNRCGVEKALSEFPNDARATDGKRADCLTCRKVARRDYYERNRLTVIAKSIANAQGRQADKAAYDAARYAKNAERERERTRARTRRIAAARRPVDRRQKEVEFAHRLIVRRRHNASLRRALVRRALAPWADLAAIQKIHEAALRCAELTGIPWHVDHVVPLNHDLVCGLHCEQNLEPLPGVMNRAKSNRYWPDMPT